MKQKKKTAYVINEQTAHVITEQLPINRNKKGTKITKLKPPNNNDKPKKITTNKLGLSCAKLRPA